MITLELNYNIMNLKKGYKHKFRIKFIFKISQWGRLQCLLRGPSGETSMANNNHTNSIWDGFQHPYELPHLD